MNRTFKKQGKYFARRQRRGVAIVEFALLVPVLLAMLLGILESGWMVKNYLTLANATRDGARIAAVGSTNAATQTRIQNSCSPLSVVSPNGSVLLQYSVNNDTTYTTWPADSGTGNGVPSGQMIKVTSISRHKPLTGFFSFLNNRDLRVSVTMRREP